MPYNFAWPIYACKVAAGDVPFYVKIWPKLAHPLQSTYFQSVFVHSTSTLTSGEKSSVNANRKSTATFPVSLR